MMFNAQQLAVVRVVCQSLHLLHRLRLFNGSDVMHVNAWSVDAFLQAQLAQAVGTSEHLCSQQLPPLVVQQSLVVLISAHTLTILHHVVATAGSPDTQAFPGRPWVWVRAAQHVAVGSQIPLL